VVRQTISKWEKGYSVPDAVMLERIAELFEVPVGELLGNEEKAADYKSELEQITAQLAILNDQYARDMARKQKIRKIKMWIALPVLAVFILSLVTIFAAVFVSCPREMHSVTGDTSTVLIREVQSEMFTQVEIASAADAAMEYFRCEFEGCKMTEIYYAGDEQSAYESKCHECETLVLYSSFEVDSAGGDGSFAADTIYSGWSWIMAKDQDGNWKVINYGFA